MYQNGIQTNHYYGVKIGKLRSKKLWTEVLSGFSDFDIKTFKWWAEPAQKMLWDKASEKSDKHAMRQNYKKEIEEALADYYD